MRVKITLPRDTAYRNLFSRSSVGDLSKALLVVSCLGHSGSDLPSLKFAHSSSNVLEKGQGDWPTH